MGRRKFLVPPQFGAVLDEGLYGRREPDEIMADVVARLWLKQPAGVSQVTPGISVSSRGRRP
jgi:hypothetical protein